MSFSLSNQKIQLWRKIVTVIMHMKTILTTTEKMNDDDFTDKDVGEYDDNSVIS